MSDSEQDKSEKPTPFKLRKAREQGQVARGMDLGFFASLTAMCACFWVGGNGIARAMGEAARNAILTGAMLPDAPAAILSITAPLFATVLLPILAVIGAVFAIAMICEILQTGIVFSAAPLKPDFSRINPATGLKRLFTLRLLLETLKNILKISFYGVVGYLVLDHSLHTEMAAIRDAASLLAMMGRMAMRLMAAFAGVALIFALVDQLIVRRDFLKKMAMSRRDVRREARDREGDPRLKQRRKQLHAEFAKHSQSLRNLRGADVLITNPEHIALALRYDRRVMAAPTIVSLAIDHQARHLKHLAFLYGIPVIENRPLARALYSRSALNRMIPEQCFQAVADIYKTLWRTTEQGAA